MEKQENDGILGVLGVILAISIAGAIVCGILACFGINVGAIGGIFCIIPILFLVIFVILQIIKEISK